jgi:hypothetical protein
MYDCQGINKAQGKGLVYLFIVAIVWFAEIETNNQVTKKFGCM